MRFGRALRRFAVLAVAICTAWLPVQSRAQSFDLDHGREALVSLDGLWRFHPGDSPLGNGVPVWSEPGFDDSAWPLLKSGVPWSAQGYPAMSGYAWYRFSVQVPQGDAPSSLLLAPIVTSYRLYIDGAPAGGSGDMPPNVIPATEFRYHLYPLTTHGSASLRTVHVAIRVWHSPLWAGYVGGGSYRPGNLAGDPALLALEQEHRRLSHNSHYVDAYSFTITAALVGFAILCLFLIRPAEREYLWFAAMLLAEAADNALYVSQQTFFWPPIPINDLLDGLLVAINIGAALCFFSRVLAIPFSRLTRILLALIAISPFCAVLYWPGWLSAPGSATLQILCLLPPVFWILAVLVDRAVRGNTDARLLLVPTGLDMGFYFADNVAIVLGQAGFTHWPRILEMQLPLPPFTIQAGTMLHLFFLLALLVFLILRFSRARRHEIWLAGEFEAAREIQQLLLPDQLDQCPGFTVDSIYQPAAQVGGDFFQQIADSHGGMLIVVGDVSGKGLPAAMMVSVLVGAVRAEAGHGAGPAALLDALNERMMGRLQGGFATCLAAHVSADGLLILANAGHLAPYLNGEELGVPGALPIGIAPGLRYEPTTVRLAPGDRLTFLSDGVVEAQSRTGELFGFERTRALSAEPAARIAQAARAFGQIDDITVVTVEFSGAATPAPAAAAVLA
jgi:hypothetical protein